MIKELADVLEKKELKDTSQQALAADKDDKALVEQASTFKFDHLDIRTPDRREGAVEPTTSTRSASTSCSTRRNAS